MRVMGSLIREYSNISLGEMIGQTWKEYFFYIRFNEFIKRGTNYYEPIDLGHILYRYIKLYIINEISSKRRQPI